MLALVLVVTLGAVQLASRLLARSLRIAPPVLLLVCAVVLGFVPVLRSVQLPPEMVLLLFLPVLLYWGSLTTSPREIRDNLRTILLNSTVLVLVTAAVTAHALGLGWGPAWVLGAAVARPTRPRWGCWPGRCRGAPSPCCARRAWSMTAPHW
ncbi:cation:proton antiporter [Micromonospora sp. NPDC005215]|uniref:cation:proton antiporter domain-containing protein n=1 Tax=Micromonospora sp. NPDC005215 TaxID=3157024 RepID=UPI0033BEEB16